MAMCFHLYTLLTLERSPWRLCFSWLKVLTRLGEPGRAVASVQAQPRLRDRSQTHGDILVLTGVRVSWSRVWGLL